MCDTTNFTIGSDVACTDGDCGELARVVVDPVARTLTHLVVEPPHQPGAGRLVPIELVDLAANGELHLRCTKTEFEALEHAEETEFLPGARGDWGYSQHEIWSQPVATGSAWAAWEWAGWPASGSAAWAWERRVPPRR